MVIRSDQVNFNKGEYTFSVIKNLNNKVYFRLSRFSEYNDVLVIRSEEELNDIIDVLNAYKQELKEEKAADTNNCPELLEDCEVASFTSIGVRYQVHIDVLNGQHTCGCMAFKHRGGVCKHIESTLARLRRLHDHRIYFDKNEIKPNCPWCQSYTI